jgi:tryptophanase
MPEHTYDRVRFFSGEDIPLELHKARMVQRIHLRGARERQRIINEAGNNTFLLPNRDVFLDMLTDSGVNAMSDAQYAAMLMADDSYAGSETYYRLESVVRDFFGLPFFLPAHQGRACENILATAYVRPGSAVVTNFHFTTTKAHITRLGGRVLEALPQSSLDPVGERPFKGDMDLGILRGFVEAEGSANVAFVRVELGTNLIGGQPVSLANVAEVSAYCRSQGIKVVVDASLLADNLFFIKTRERGREGDSLRSLVRELASHADIVYFSGRKLGCARGGGIAIASEEDFRRMRDLVPLFEGFLTYGGMSVREMEAMAVGITETLDMDTISQTPIFVEALGRELVARGVPVVIPFGGLGCHLDAMRFLPHIPQSQYPSGALAVAVFLAGGIRGMERGTLSEQRAPDGSESFANMELLRLAIPKRVFTLSQIKYVADRVGWLHENRGLVGGLEFEEEPKTLRFFLGRLRPVGDWQDRLVSAFLRDMPNGL